VLINLMQNALEAIEHTPAPRVSVRAEDRGERVAVLVADNGPGVAPDILEQLFTPFNTSKPRGLGLGLVISKEILADYGGEISVETGPAGSCFTIHLSKDQA
jgi:two-component system C4-dicarboxylate transport sensor histidine kinase DctB